MRPYFEKMNEFGNELKPGQIKSSEANVKQIKDVEAEIDSAVEDVKNVGFPTHRTPSGIPRLHREYVYTVLL